MTTSERSGGSRLTLALATAFVVMAIGVESPAGLTAAQQESDDPALTEVWEPVPGMVDPGDPGPMSAAPSDAIVLFAGNDLAEWRHEDGADGRWTVNDGAFTVLPGSGTLFTRRAFGDVQLHIEWRSPATVVSEGQGRGNSGVYLMERYEVQILDSWNNPTYSNGQAASVYKQFIPQVNASRPPGEWQSYDILFEAPRFDDTGGLMAAATPTLFHNGVLVQHHVTLRGPTVFIGEPAYEPHPARAPLMLQDHGNLVSFRNVWVHELPSRRE